MCGGLLKKTNKLIEKWLGCGWEEGELEEGGQEEYTFCYKIHSTRVIMYNMMPIGNIHYSMIYREVV